jgi:hypothetical protein
MEKVADLPGILYPYCGGEDGEPVFALLATKEPRYEH